MKNLKIVEESDSSHLPEVSLTAIGKQRVAVWTETCIEVALAISKQSWQDVEMVNEPAESSRFEVPSVAPASLAPS